MSRGPGDEWFRDWFGDDYLRVYPHRDEAEAADAVELFLGEARLRPGDRVLDLACGAGRHLGLLRAAGHPTTGLDLSRPLLRRAREAPGEGGVAQGDMRELPFGSGGFGAVVQFFTSFGYFATRAEDRETLREVRRVLRDGGTFLIDFLNAERVREELVPEDVRRAAGRTVRQRRWIEDGAVVKRIEIEEPGEEAEVYHERVRLYGPDELAGLAAEEGLVPRSRYGDYDGGPFRGADSPRLLLLGEAA